MNRLIGSLAFASALALATGCAALTGGDEATAVGDQPITTGTLRAEPVETASPTEPTDRTDTTAPTDSVTVADRDAIADQDLVWTVIAVERDDVLNVRDAPDPEAPIVATLAPWTTDVDVLTESEVTPSGTWRVVRTKGGAEGWVNTRFLVAQPAELSQSERDEMIDRSAELVAWARTGTSGEDGAWMFADRALWVGGRGIYGDGATGWNWIPAGDVDRAADWDRVRTFELGADFGDYGCGADCEKSLNEFIDFARVDETTNYLIDDVPDANARGFIDGALWQAPETLHRVVIDTPTSDPQVSLDWQRIHVVFDWSGGRPEVLLINTHGWTP